MNNPDKQSQQRNLVALLALLLLTVLSANIRYTESLSLSLLALLFVVFKAWFVTHYFMELSHAPSLWCNLLFSYIVIIPSVLGIIYYVAR
ncbi:MAG: hypothetical protein BM565_10225 [Gammaproteobacteria bacterium MedPE]|nr:MAG: hypothetical protein BM565_10225 [Gammaproteobacteria bacterium MedPE]